MNIELKRTLVLQFYKTFVEDYILEDLEILRQIKPNSLTGLGGCTIPTAMAIISSIELLGFLLYPKGKTGNSKDNITYFITYNNYSLFPGSYDSSVIEKLFNYRHGMMHHFFPKFKGGFAGICKNEEEKSLLISHNINGNKEESLNISVLLNDFNEAIKKLKVLLEVTSDERIFDTIDNGLKSLDYYLTISSTITTCTTINPGTPQNK